jgi:ribosomal protein S18 acetylase RimI-like enzyme
MKFRFTSVQEKEIDQVLQALKEAAERIHSLGVDHWQQWNNPPNEKIAWVREGVNQGEIKFIFNEINEQIGIVRILTKDELYWGNQEVDAVYIHSLIVFDTFNGRGYGKQIISQVAELAKKDGNYLIRLDADQNNSKLCNYYQSMGFRKVGIKQFEASSYMLMERKID